ncbi:RHS repeat-associated core domain-containing protein [Fluviicola sp.]|uniref:RHS repeat domain-containing protein n=1 Tax=Fluviicola sp. TaxID=1917219 RepID=UPI0026332680|nr:RHS repeat-associated core domain-containing protein [Fluviicola sp.]
MKQLVIIILLSLTGLLSWGQELLTTSNYPLTSIGVGSNILAEDPLISAGSGVLFNVDRRFRLELVYNRNSHSDLVNAPKWRLTLTVKNTTTSQEENLMIDFTPDGTANYAAWADFKSALPADNKMTWNITNMVIQKHNGTSWIAGTVSDLPLTDIHLEAMVFNDRIVELDFMTAPKLSIANTNQLNWSHITGAIEYDVEWVFIGEYDNFAYGTDQSPFDFKEPVRITTYKHSHTIDLVYPKGIIYFRIRPRGYFFKTGSNKEIYTYGNWFYAKKTGGNMSLAITTDFEGKKNWQYTVAYAENGLSASTMTYFDGSLRARQQLMQQKSTGEVVAAATLYDYEGRSSVQVIPTPINANSLSYYNNLHRDASGGEFDKTDFDLGTSAAMGTASGAGRYYSSANDLTSDPFRDRIPDAEGYPYSQVIVSNDNLGRPKVSSGVGLTHRMGAGHETYYYYVKPTERDLRELFGSNVGNLSHYDKQVQIDVNGQASVSYSDQAGHVIATGLMASAPAGLLPLDNNPAGTPVTTTSSLMPMNLITTDPDGSLQSVTDYTHFNQGTNPITLNYDLVTGGVNALSQYFGTSCASCFYELEIKVFDPTGAQVNLSYSSVTMPGAPMSTIRERYSGSELSCVSPNFNSVYPAPISKTITLSMQGEYRIQKILKVDQQALSNYLASNAATLPGAPDLQDYLDQYTSNVVTLGCGFDCASFYEQECRQELGLPLTGLLSSLPAADRDAVNTCISSKCATSAVDGVTDEMTSDPGQCSMLLGVLKQDVSPGGWVFDSYAPWRNNTLNWDINYPLTSSTTFNPVSLEDLADHWQDGWEDLIVSTHPEYCHYTKCISLADVKQYAYTINSVSTFLGAQPTYINSSGDLVVANDPLATHPLYASSFSSFLTGLNNNFQGTGGSIYDYISGMVVTNANLFQDENGVLLTGDELINRIWTYVRSVYLGERNNLIESGYAPSCNYLDDENANFIDPATLSSPTGATDLLGVIDDNCANICANNVAFWMGEITNNCDDLDQNEKDLIRYHLQNYCLTDCNGYSNMTGAIQMSDLLNSNPDLTAVQGIMAANCESYSLGLLAADDTCSSPVSVTYSNVAQFGAELNKKLALLTSLAADISPSTTNYTNFITSPLIAPNVASFSYAYWTSSAMKLKLSNAATSLNVQYDVNKISSIEVLNYEVVPSTPPALDRLLFTVKVTLLTGTINTHVIDEYSITKNPSGAYSYSINELDRKSISYRYCEPDLEPFADTFSLQAWVDDCINDIMNEATTLANLQYAVFYENYINGLTQSFSTNCFNANLQEQFSITYGKCEYYYTLYYYDQAGNLVQTVPPAGVHIVPPAGFTSGGVWDGVTQPGHLLKTVYTYNSLNQPVKTTTPDGGTSKFWYNSAQQLRYSQTAQQATENKYSYSKFDEFGRPLEAGVFVSTNLLNTLAFIDNNSYPAISGSTPAYNVVKTIYHKQSLALNTALGWAPKDLNNRVAAVMSYEVYTGTPAAYDNAIFYNYDIHGNVKQLLTDIPLMGANNRYKTVDYQYDVYSGKVLNVIYQKDKEDQFLHRYSYDDDNRLTQVQTSRDGVKWDADARYYYYLHGPLARTELGEDKVQGTDYAYTVHGWLKGVNSNSGVSSRDMGKDGATRTHKNRYVAQDAIGLSLTYFNAGTEIDYKSIAPPAAADNWLSSSESAFLTGSVGTINLYNGNIRAMVTSIKKENNVLLGNVVRVYKYDQLQRLKEVQTYTAANQAVNNAWTGATPTANHYSSYTYDLNGNIKNLNRKDYTGASIDEFTYGYDLESPSGYLKSNRLYHIDDAVLAGTFDDDVDDMGTLVPANINTTTNYVYDASGRLIRDNQENITNILWNAQNKVTKIIHSSLSKRADMEFRYNAMGQRVVKITKPKVLSGSTYIVNTAQITTTYYALDAQGNLMATYTQKGDVAGTFASTGANNTAMLLEDFHLYGASRLGSQVVDQTLSTTPNVNYVKSGNRASSIIGITGSTYNTTGTTYVQYRAGSTVLNDPYPWVFASGLDANLKGLMAAINAKTITTDISAALWYDKNNATTAYVELSFSQPGNWQNQTLAVYTGATISVTLNSTLTANTAHMTRQLGYGTAKGSDVVGSKRYELSNHLGNVLAVITDRKWGVDDGVYTLSTGVKTASTPDKITDYYLPTIVSYSDYDPFGTIQSGRNNGEVYRYGFQGQERDDEIKGVGNSINYEYRMHDPRIGRFFAVDPLAAKYPYYSSYQFSGNRVIDAVELEGLEPKKAGSLGQQAKYDIIDLLPNEADRKQLKEFSDTYDAIKGKIGKIDNMLANVDFILNANKQTDPKQLVESYNSLTSIASYFSPGTSFATKASSAYIGVVLPIIEIGLSVISIGLREKDRSVVKYGETLILHPGVFGGGKAMYDFLSEFKGIKKAYMAKYGSDDGGFEAAQKFQTKVINKGDWEVPESVKTFFKENSNFYNFILSNKVPYETETFMGVDSLWPDSEETVNYQFLWLWGSFDQIETSIYGGLKTGMKNIKAK